MEHMLHLRANILRAPSEQPDFATSSCNILICVMQSLLGHCEALLLQRLAELFEYALIIA